jgi:hypothetical protein
MGNGFTSPPMRIPQPAGLHKRAEEAGLVAVFDRQIPAISPALNSVGTATFTDRPAEQIKKGVFGRIRG